MAVALGTVLTNFIGLFGLTPLYPEVARDLHIGPDAFGGYFLIQGAISTLLQLPVGLLSDRIGRRPVITLGLSFMVVGQLLRWQAGDGLVFGIGQLFTGLSSPFAIAPSYALVADAYRGAGRAQAIGVLQASANVGMASGLVMAGLLSPLVGWRGYSLGVALLTLVLLPLAATQADPRRSAGPEVLAPTARGIGHLFGDRSARLLAVAAVLVMVSWGGSIFLLPFVARAHSIGEVGGSLLLAPNLVGSFLGGIVAGRWADRAGARTPAIVACSAGAVALLALGVLQFSPLIVVVSGVLLGAAVSGAVALAASSVAEAASRKGGGTGAALAIVRTGQGLGSAVAPALAGFAFVRTGAGPAYVLLAICIAAGGGLLATNVTRRSLYHPLEHTQLTDSAESEVKRE
jgi:MFS family permease